jgi:antibiotic biosynthesis monooxygenase (ABM) superfamily enzyme
MFIQVIRTKVRDGAGIDALLERWEAELRPGASGFLGSTSGTTGDGTLFVMARFESRATAEANSARPEQAAWWDEVQACFDGEASFHDCDQVESASGGASL